MVVFNSQVAVFPAVILQPSVTEVAPLVQVNPVAIVPDAGNTVGVTVLVALPAVSI